MLNQTGCLVVLFANIPVISRPFQRSYGRKTENALLSPKAAISCYFAVSETSSYNAQRLQDMDLSQDYDINEVIEMAMSDHTSFGDIEKLYGLSEDDVKRILRQNLKRGSYEAWRRRVRKFSDRREHYK